MSDNKEFMDTLKTDLNIYDDQVYAFTPQGDVLSLPACSTPIDFAYMIHTAVGNKMVGARVNGKIVTFDYKIKNGDRIEILTSQNSKGPGSDWLNLAKSSQARTKINQWFKKELKEENIIKGRELLAADAKKKGFVLADLMKPEWIDAIYRKYAFKSWDAICAGVGFGGIKEGQIINRLIEEYKKETKKNQTAEDIIKKMEETAAIKHTPRSKSRSGVIVKGVGDVAVRFSHCCNPVPGDEIVGFVTRGRGVSIHRTDCVNIINLNEFERHRLIDAEWDTECKRDMSFTAEVKIICGDRVGLVLDISKAIADEGILIKSFNTRTTKDGTSILNVIMVIKDTDQLEKICTKFKNIPSVDEIERVSG